ncbi:Protoporphyrinogen IX oxidase, novel form, HemJ [hydrothermal vent metagenome]|uniref:Protoporphyrinogen IX oxidase, novel form, HemJ n=1 Tax=hydrothermal vent metagenome TaxID=652676 RepID=A0A3B1E6E5_9ZZZZ
MNIMDYYLGIVTFHVVAVISWMAVLFYQPRLYAYHTEYKDKKEFVDIVKIQEYKMYKYIRVPALWSTVLSGILMIYANPSLLQESWMIAKLIVLILVIAYSFSLDYFMKILKDDRCTKSGQFFRAYNEVPTLLSILIVTFVITKSIPIWFCIGITLFFGFIIYKILTLKK